MAIEVGGFSAGTTGNKTINLNGAFTPSFIEFDVGPRLSTNETDIRRSTGCTDGTNHYAISTFAGTNKGTRESTTKCIMHYIDNAGTATLKVQGSWVSFGSGQFVVNMDTVDSNYVIRFKAFS